MVCTPVALDTTLQAVAVRLTLHKTIIREAKGKRVEDLVDGHTVCVLNDGSYTYRYNCIAWVVDQDPNKVIDMWEWSQMITHTDSQTP